MCAVAGGGKPDDATADNNRVIVRHRGDLGQANQNRGDTGGNRRDGQQVLGGGL
jgi:hypothetical protein